MSVKSYLKPILSRKHADLKLADASAVLIDEHIGALIENLTSDAGTYAGVAKRRTVMAKDVEIVVRMALKHDTSTAGLATLVAAAASALEAYHHREKDAEKKSRSGRAQLVFPISRIEAHMRRVAAKSLRLSDDVGVFTAALAEMAASDVLDLAGAQTKEDGKKIVSPGNVQAALEKTAWKTLMTLPGVGDAGQSAGDA